MSTRDLLQSVTDLYEFCLWAVEHDKPGMISETCRHDLAIMVSNDPGILQSAGFAAKRMKELSWPKSYDKEIVGLSKLNLEPKEEEYLRECLAAGRNWFVTRQRIDGRCIQASGESKKRVAAMYRNWKSQCPVNLIEVRDGTVVIWHLSD
jgi:hypothetical protein